eukprot:scaffold294380_cov30-Tisochrysis_lutea.AAC.3
MAQTIHGRPLGGRHPRLDSIPDFIGADPLPPLGDLTQLVCRSPLIPLVSEQEAQDEPARVLGVELASKAAVALDRRLQLCLVLWIELCSEGAERALLSLSVGCERALTVGENIEQWG